MLAARRPIGVTVPDLFNGRGVQVAENRLPVEVGTAERHAPIPQDREGQPRAIAGVIDVRFGIQRAGPVVEVRDVNLVRDGAPVFDEGLLVGGVVLSDDEGSVWPRFRCARSVPALDVPDDLVDWNKARASRLLAKRGH